MMPNAPPALVIATVLTNLPIIRSRKVNVSIKKRVIRPTLDRRAAILWKDDHEIEEIEQMKSRLQHYECEDEPDSEIEADSAVELGSIIIGSDDTGTRDINHCEREPETAVGRESCTIRFVRKSATNERQGSEDR